MALIDDCFFCSLSVAASVIGVYTLVAYIIAFFMETWWIFSTPVSLPSPVYVLCAGYLTISVFSGVLLRGISVKNTLFLLEWLLVVAALSVPEGVLVYFMSIHYWNIRSLYGLIELTCWICRAIVNVSGMICVQSLYSTWQEEKEVLRRLRDLNMTRVLPANKRNSVSSLNGFSKGSLSPQTQVLNNGAFVPSLQRSGSMVSVLTVSRPQSPVVFTPPPSVVPVPLHPFVKANPALGMAFKPNEFNASQFDLTLMTSMQGGVVNPMMNKSYSLMDLRSVGSVSDIPRKTMSVVDFPVEKKVLFQTQSLDRRILKSSEYWRGGSSHSEIPYASGRLKNAYFPPFVSNDLMINPAMDFVQARNMGYRMNINSFYPGKSHSRSKHSIGSESDDLQKYRDIAL